VNLPTTCLGCGVCCFSRLETYVRVTGDDWARLEDEAERMVNFINNRAYLKIHDGHCAALAIRTDAGGGRVYFCTVYERRPQICRDLARGSPQCEAERELKGDRAGQLRCVFLMGNSGTLESESRNCRSERTKWAAQRFFTRRTCC